MYFKLKDSKKGLLVPFNADTARPEFGQGMPWKWQAFENISSADLAPVLKEDGEPGVADGSHPHLRDRRCHIMTIPHYSPLLTTLWQNMYRREGIEVVQCVAWLAAT
jgi:hypothetical protein